MQPQAQPQESPTDIASFNLTEVKTLAANDPNFLSAMAMPGIFEYSWPSIFIAIWTWLLAEVSKERSFSRLAVGIPRGFGKTTMVKLFILFCVLFTRRKFILVISANAKHAENIISDVVDMLDEENIRVAFGNWRGNLERDTQSVKKFTFRGRDIILAAIGSGGAVRGLNLKNARPDVIIFEDVQTREEADSRVVSEDLYKWMLGTAMKAKSPKGCLTLFIANMYPTDHSILKKLKANKFWDKFIVGGITADGQSLWEELQPLAQLIEEYEAEKASGHPEIFYAEVLNDEHASVNNLVDISALPVTPILDNDIPLGKAIIIDPATNKENSDAVAIGYFEYHEVGGIVKPYLRQVTSKNLSPLATIKEAVAMAQRHSCFHIFVEGNAYQSTLNFWADLYCRQFGILGIEFLEIYSGQTSKNQRIVNMLKSYRDGDLYVHNECAAQVNHQVSGFQPLKTNNVDDILDLLAYAPKVYEKFGILLTNASLEGSQLMEREISSAGEYGELDNAPF